MAVHHTMRALLAGAVVLGAGAVVLCGLQGYIGWEARATGSRAMREFAGDRVAALAQLVDCEACPLRERSRAVWALGELADPRALPVLRRHHRGAPCNHAAALCQYELGKAIGKIQGTWGPLPYFRRGRRAA